MTQSEDESLLDQLDAAGAWQPLQPPPGFAKTVADRETDPAPENHGRAQNGRARRGLVIAALACAAAGVATWAVWPGAATVRGTLDAGLRETADIGEDAVVVAEPGATLDWTIAPGGAVRVAQHSGSAFYRVDKGSSFEVVTPVGRVEVTGTCFTVDVRKADMNRQMGKGIVLGASLAAAAVVTVYEGNVVLANDNGRVDVGAGDSAVARDGRRPTADDDDGGDGGQTRQTDDPEGRAARQEAEHLRKQVAEARAEASARQAESAPEADSRPTGAAMHPSLIPGFDYFDPSPEALQEMARCGVVAWDQPPIWEENSSLDHELAVAADLSGDEAEAVESAFDAFRSGTVDHLRGRYEELGGEPEGVEAFSPQELLQLVYGRLNPEDLVTAREAIAREKAGLEEPPSELTEAGQFMRWEAGLGDAFENAIGKTLGPDRARDVRAAQGGWGSKRMTYTKKCMED